MRLCVALLGLLLLAGCDGYGPRRYELVSAAGGVYLLDTKTGRVWQHESGAFEPQVYLMDSSDLAGLNKGRDAEGKKFIKNNYAYQPNTWEDFFQGLGQ